MRKYRSGLLFLLCAAVCLSAAWFWGGDYANRDGGGTPSPTPAASGTATGAGGGSWASAPPAVPIGTPDPPPPSATPDAPDLSPSAAPPSASPPPRPGPTAEPEKPAEPALDREQDLTDPAPADEAPSAEPREDADPGESAYTCTLSVRCDTISDNLAYLDPEKHALVPADGVIFPATTVTFSEGESAFTLLQREMRRAQIHMEFVRTPLYNSAYIEGIHNLYAFDVGELSGWMYRVNDEFPNYGCSRYLLRDGDAVEFVYTCDLGRDVGGGDVVQD
ncbi:MAG: DUF4430 domain-containing protein [Oscillospiraceae bacterium]|nr:DUF4430 domain-containing protein [Oscillospiraceae bacterium]